MSAERWTEWTGMGPARDSRGTPTTGTEPACMECRAPACHTDGPDRQRARPRHRVAVRAGRGDRLAPARARLCRGAAHHRPAPARGARRHVAPFQLTDGVELFPSCRVEHDVINDNPFEFAFVEIEVKGSEVSDGFQLGSRSRELTATKRTISMIGPLTQVATRCRSRSIAPFLGAAAATAKSARFGGDCRLPTSHCQAQVEAFNAGKQLLVWRQQVGFAAARSGTSAHGVL